METQVVEFGNAAEFVAAVIVGIVTFGLPLVINAINGFLESRRWASEQMKMAAKQRLEEAMPRMIAYVQHAVTSVVDQARLEVKPEAMRAGLRYLNDTLPDTLRELGVTEQAISQRVVAELSQAFLGQPEPAKKAEPGFASLRDVQLPRL